MSENLPAIGEWGNESADLFRSARKALTPSAADRNQVRARLALKIGAGAAALSVATTTSKAAAGTAASAGAGAGAGAGASGATAGAAVKGASIPLLAKIIAPVVIAGAVGSATVAPRVIEARKHATTTSAPAEAPTTKAKAAPLPSAPTRTDEAPAPPPPAALSVSIDDLPAAATSATPHARHRKAAATPETAAEAAARDEEAALVAEIDAALRSGDTARASRLADEHQRRFPNGLLVQEREGARVLVRCTSTPNAALATTFLRAHPRSPMRARILAACGTTPSSSSDEK